MQTIQNIYMMHKIGIFYGSSTGTCEGLAAQLAGELGVADNDVHSANKLTEELVNTYDVLVSDDVVFTKAAFDAFVAAAQKKEGAK